MGQDTNELEAQDEPRLADDEMTDEEVSEVAGGMWSDTYSQDLLGDVEVMMNRE